MDIKFNLIAVFNRVQTCLSQMKVRLKNYTGKMKNNATYSTKFGPCVTVCFRACNSEVIYITMVKKLGPAY